MYKLLMYDIEDDKVRAKLSKLCEKLGFTRLQKSVWIGHGNEVYWGKSAQRIKKHCASLAGADNVSIITLAPENIKGIVQFGETDIIPLIADLTRTFLLI
jgi:CRISPR-associated endonuclease Cas2